MTRDWRPIRSLIDDRSDYLYREIISIPMLRGMLPPPEFGTCIEEGDR